MSLDYEDPKATALGAGGRNSGERIRVAIRARPIHIDTKSPHSNGVISLSPDGTQVYVRTDEKNAASFRCERFLDPSITQEAVFEYCGAKELIESALDGFPVTIFAYGQTGAGKSFTIFGKEDGIAEKKLNVQETDGILPRTAAHMMHLIDTRKNQVEYKLRVTCVEIYNEQVKDLFDPKKESLAVRWTKEHGFYLENATVIEVTSVKELIRVAKAAATNRCKSSHLLNDKSNRSHCLLTIYIDATPFSEQEIKKYGKLTIVDLAGSERANDTGATGTQLKETGHINKSLYCLSNVIQAINSKQKGKFIPFRDSKLTMLLIDSLGGNSKTLMLACVNSSPLYAAESIRTLEFAMGVAKIKNKPTALLNPHEKLISDLKEQIRLLTLENMMLRSRAAAGEHIFSIEEMDNYIQDEREEKEKDQLQVEKQILQNTTTPYGAVSSSVSMSNQSSIKPKRKKKVFGSKPKVTTSTPLLPYLQNQASFFLPVKKEQYTSKQHKVLPNQLSTPQQQYLRRSVSMTTTTKIDTKSSQLSVNNQSSKFNHSYNENNEDDLFGVETIQSNTITSEAEAQIQNLLTSFTTKQKNLSISKPNMTASVMAESFSSTNMFHNAMNSQKHNHFMESSEISNDPFEDDNAQDLFLQLCSL